MITLKRLLIALFAITASGLLVVGLGIANAETPAERCKRETTAYNNAWKNAWAQANPGRKPSDAPKPPVPYKCGGQDRGTAPTLAPGTDTPNETAPKDEAAPSSNSKEWGGPSSGAPTERRDIQHPGNSQPTITASPGGDVSEASRFLSAFRENLVRLAGQGDDTARRNIPKFDRLTQEQKNVFANYVRRSITGMPHNATPLRNGRSVTLDGPAKLVTDTVAKYSRHKAARYRVHAWSTQTFTVLGVDVVKTKLESWYYTDAVRVVSLGSHQGMVERNYDPTATVNIQKGPSFMANGGADFQILVEVRRGAVRGLPTWSTRSANQYMTVDGKGVTGSGWR